MKKLFALLLALVMLFSVATIFAGCEDSGIKKKSSSSSKDDEDEENDETNPPEPTVPEGNQIGDRCYGMDLQIVDENGDTGETINPAKTGKVTLINFWGTWCVPCTSELPHMDELARNYDINLIAIHSIDGKDKMPGYIQRFFPDSPIIFAWDAEQDDVQTGKYYIQMGDVGFYPYSVVLDENGIITHTFNGIVTYEQIENAVVEAGAAANASKEDNMGSAEDEVFPSEPEAEALKTITDGKLIVVTNAAFPPYEYVENGNIVGIDIEIAQAIADRLGLELQIQDMEFNTVSDAVCDGKADICIAGMTATTEWETVIDFTDTYTVNKQVILVAANSPLTSSDDLICEDAYHTVGVIRDTTANIYALFDIEDSGLGVVMRYNKVEDAVANLISGKLDCIIIYDKQANQIVSENEDLEILDTYTEEEYKIGVSEDNPQLLMAINDILQELKNDGTIDQIIAKHTWG